MSEEDNKKEEKNDLEKEDKKEEKLDKEEEIKTEKSENLNKKENNKSNKEKKENKIDEEENSLNNEDEDNNKSELDSESSKDIAFVTASEKNESQDEEGEGEGEDDEENDDEDDDIIDDDDEDDDDEDDKSDDTFDDKKKKDPYHTYIISKVEYSINMENLAKGDYLYGIKENKFYRVTNYTSKESNNSDKFNITLSLVDNLKKKTKKSKIKMKKINDNILFKALKYENNNKEKNQKEVKLEENNLDKKEEEIKDNKYEEKDKENIIDESKEEKEKEKEKKEDKEKKEEKKEKEKINEEKDIKEKNNIENKKEKEKSNEEINKENKTEDRGEINKEKNMENNKENNKEKEKEKEEINDNNEVKEKETKKDKKNNEEKKEGSKKTSKKGASNKTSDLTITIKDFTNYTNLQKINIFYINYLNIFHRIDMIININWSINDIIATFQKLYHIPSDKYSEEKLPLLVFLNNKRYSPINKTQRKFFTPNKFDYKNDFLIILEKETFKFEEYDMGTRNNYINMKGVKVPHFVYSSYYNYQVDSFIISKNVPSLECEIYEIKKEFNFNIDPENEKFSKKKIKEFMDLNWKERSTLISVIKSGALRKSKENYDANCFEINRRFIISQGKIYIFLVTTSNKKTYVFNPRHISKNGLIIVTKEDKGILNGFKAKIISDFIAY